MSNRYIKKIISVLSCALLAALFITTLFFSAPKTAAVPETTGSLTYNDKVLEIGKDLTAVRISDLNKLNKITKVNYVADKFVKQRTLDEDIQIVDLTKPFEFAEKGTLIFVVMNLDPAAEDFKEQQNKLAAYKIGDYWQFTLSLPKIFCASNIYLQYDLFARHGEIENYDFIEFTTSYDKKTEKFSAETATEYLSLQFYTRREALEKAFNSAQIITVHYQSAGGAFSAVSGCPLIGTESAVKGIYQTSENLLIAFAILAAVVFAVLVVLSVLERSKRFASAIVWVLGITVLLLCRFFLSGVTSAPLFWTALSLAMPFVILGGAQLALGENFGKIPIKYIFPAFSAIGAVLALICPFIPFGAASAMRIVCTVIKAIGAVALTAFIGLAIFNKKDEHGILQTVCAAVIAVAIIASVFMPQIFPAQINPIFWLCAATAFITFISVFIMFSDMKKSNDYLTDNLHKEVERQVKDIKAVIAERDNLLQFVSHDMKKPLTSAVALCDTAIGRANDSEQRKTISIIKQDAERVISNLSEIATYAKLNYLAEPSQVVDMSELCALLYKYHEFDCNANGIVLKNTVDTPVKAFVKPKGIENVVSNIIINAIEHANCKTITLSLRSDKNKTVLCVADDGKGIDGDLDVFKPYVSENDSETGGIGLYICKNIIESMNGALTFETGGCGTTFYISLLKA